MERSAVRNVFDDSTITAELRVLDINSDARVCHRVLSRLLVAVIKGMDIREMIPKILQLLSHPDLIAKKVVYSLLAEHANQQPDVALLAINTLTQECINGNPMVRGLALKTVCSLNHENFLEYGQREVERALDDNSAYVRRVAINCCGLLNSQNPNICQDLGLVNKLYSMLRDTDPIVIVNAVIILEEILKKEGGIVINRTIALHLLNKLDIMSAWGQIYIFQILLKYKPKSEDEVFDILNLLDTYLTHNSASLMLSCLKLFFHFIQELPHLKPEVIKRALQGIVKTLSCGNHELVFCILEAVEEYLEEFSAVIGPFYKHFLCKYREPDYLKEKKIKMLSNMITQDNGLEILQELSLYASDTSKSVSLETIMSVGSILKKHPALCKKSFKILKTLLNSDVTHIVSNSLQMLQCIDIASEGEELLTLIGSKLDILQDDPGKCAFLNIIGSHGDKMADSPYMIEEFLDMHKDSWSESVQMCALQATVKIFLHHPATTQPVLSDMLEMCMTSDSFLIQDQVVLYYNLIKHDINMAKGIILS